MAEPTMDVSISTDCETLTITDTTPFTDDDDTTTDDAGYPRSADTTITLKITYKATTGDSVRHDAVINPASSTVLDIKPTKDGWYLLEVTIVNSYTADDFTLTGTVEPTNGSTTVNGDSSAFQTDLDDGDAIEIGGEIYYVDGEPISQTEFKIHEKYAGTTATGLTATRKPTFSFSNHDDAVVFCNGIKCRDEKALEIVKDSLCGCETDGDVEKVYTIDTHITAVNAQVDDNNPSGAQKTVELLDELCKDCS